MVLKEVIDRFGLKVLSGAEHLGLEVTGGYCSDLLSDVMGNADEGHIWITIQVHKNIVAVAALKELSAILLVKGLKATDEAIEAANEQGIPILQTDESAFEIAGKLYNLIH